MAAQRDEAEALAQALRLSICSVAQVVAWADAQIERESQPALALCDVSVSGDRYPQDVAGLLCKLPGAPTGSEVQNLLVGLIFEKLNRDLGMAKIVADAICELARNDDIDNDHLANTAWWTSDGIDLAEAGLTSQTKEQLAESMLAALRDAVGSQTTAWSFDVTSICDNDASKLSS